MGMAIGNNHSHTTGPAWGFPLSIFSRYYDSQKGCRQTAGLPSRLKEAEPTGVVNNADLAEEAGRRGAQ